MQLQIKLTTQEIDYLKKLKDVKDIHTPPLKKSSSCKIPSEEEEKKNEFKDIKGENNNNNESLFGKSILGVSSIHELQSFLEVFNIFYE